MLFRKIKELINPPKSTGIPLNLSQGHINRLRELNSSNSFKDFQRLLDELCTIYGETLLQQTSNKDVHFYRGYIQGLRRSGTIIEEISKAMEGKDAERTKREHLADERRRLQQRLATYGTPFWTSGGGAV